MNTKNLLSNDPQFASHLASALTDGGWNAEKSMDAIRASGIYVVDGRQYVEMAAGEKVPRPAEIPVGATVFVWVPAPSKLAATLTWGAFAQGPRPLILGALQEAALAPFRL